MWMASWRLEFIICILPMHLGGYMWLPEISSRRGFLLCFPSLCGVKLKSRILFHLYFLQKYEGDLTQLGLYFVIENNEYGEQAQVELLPGGKDIQVNNDNVIRYIHLVANYRLNIQVYSVPCFLSLK